MVPVPRRTYVCCDLSSLGCPLVPGSDCAFVFVAPSLSLYVEQLKVGKIEAGKSYVPAGLSAAEYSKVRAAEAKKKADRYEKNVKKAGVFQDYTEWYKKRGTDLSQDWKKNKNTLGHTMAKVSVGSMKCS